MKNHFYNFEENEGFKVIIWRPSAIDDNINIEQIAGQDTGQDTGHDAGQVNKHKTKYIALEELSHRVVWVLKKEMSRDELMHELGLSGRNNFTNIYLKPALENKWIEMTLPNKPTSRNQKYRLTRKGKKLKKDLNA
ncbi:Fic family protein [Lentimicrobium sp. S6]|uniref:Fic family protein n=1 Tax=Lentimicrobium sp. S6 TaxID=2735872 RepID=UPI0015551962|nr:hypothetical protein [Lentimicrobium sp. S6]NPD47052.1 hypothetical protein [Lentimicrobium sp. S6]